MPKIPVYTQQTIASGSMNSPRATAADFAGGLARAGDELGDAAMKVSIMLDAKAEDDARAWVAENLPKMKLDWMENMEQRKANVTPGAPDFTGSALKDYDTYTADAVKNAPSEKAGKFLAEQLRNFKLNIADNAMGFEAGERVRFTTEKFTNGMNNAARLVQMDTGLADTTLAEQRALIDSMNLPPANKAALREQSDAGIAYAAGTAIADKDPQGWLDYASGRRTDMPSVLGLLTPQQVNALTNSAEGAIKTRNAIARQALAQTYDDHVAAMQAGVPVASHMSDAAIRSLADTPEKANDLVADYHMARDTGAALQSMKGKTIAELSVMAEAETAALQEGGAENFSDRARNASIIVQAAGATVKAMNDDPAAYVLQNSPTVQKARAAMEASQQDDRAREAYYTALLAEQNRIGIMEPKILSDGEKEQVAAAFRNQDMAGANMVGTIDAMQKQYGRYWPDVYRQMGKDMPEAAFVIGSGSPDRQTSLDIARIAGLKDSDLEVPSDVKTGINDSLEKAIEPIRGSFVFQHGGMDAFNAFNTQAEKLARYYVISMGKSDKDAVKMSVSGLFSSYGFGEINGVPFRAPKNVDVKAVEAGTKMFASEYLSRFGVQMPQEYVANGYTNQEFLNDVKDNIFLVTSDDEKGAILMRNTDTGRPWPVLDTDGKPIFMPWDALSDVKPGMSGKTQFFNAEFIKAAP